MPFDGIVTKTVVDELNNILAGARIDKAFQTERDEVIFHVRAKGENKRLLISASPSFARIHLTDNIKENPATPPVFCMLLRKHVVSGRIIEFRHFDYDRIIEMSINTLNDFNEPITKYLIIEIMGKYSNIILLNENRYIIDSIKHVDFDVSRVREVMPGRMYKLPPSQNKINPEDIFQNVELLKDAFNNPDSQNLRVDKVLLNTIRGFSPLLCKEICQRCDLPELIKAKDLKESDLTNLFNTTTEFIKNIIDNKYKPCVYFKEDKQVDVFDFHSIPLTQYPYRKEFDSISDALDYFYTNKDNQNRLSQKKSSLVKVISNNIERCAKKINILNNDIRNANKMDTYKLYGDLLTANLYRIENGMDSVKLENFYSENLEEIEIPLDKQLSPSGNAQYYYKKYNKARRTLDNAVIQLEDAQNELNYFETTKQMLDMAQSVDEINEIRNELVEQGYIKIRKSNKRKQEKKLKPRVYYSTDGFEILVGRNNKQNDELTLKTASKHDIWLHTKDIPGSHVIIRSMRKEIPETTIIEAAKLAAFYSKAANSENVPVDYTKVRNVRKPHGAKPGMVIYDNHQTLYVTPEELMAD